MSSTSDDPGRTDRIQRWLTLGANIGVLVGIFLLITELSQNRTMMMAQTRSELSNEIVDLFARVAENESLAAARGLADAGEDLTTLQAYQYALITRAFFRYWENVHYQYRVGLYDDEEFGRQREAWQFYASQSAAVVDFWCTNRLQFSAEFVEEFDGILTTRTC